jgi:uncharacterized membrane protein YagU involved in acid resistance
MKTSHRLLIGAISGIVATGPMTVAMILLHRRLPMRERYPLPPREITMKLARGAGVADSMDSESRSALTLISHFGYGAAGGVLFAGTTDPERAPVLKGLLFGMLVWAASYLGWLPATGVLTPATEHPERRNWLMIAAHLIWGASLSRMASLLMSEARQPLTGPFSSAHTPHRDLAEAR